LPYHHTRRQGVDQFIVFSKTVNLMYIFLQPITIKTQSQYGVKIFLSIFEFFYAKFLILSEFLLLFTFFPNIPNTFLNKIYSANKFSKIFIFVAFMKLHRLNNTNSKFIKIIFLKKITVKKIDRLFNVKIFKKSPSKIEFISLILRNFFILFVVFCTQNYYLKII